VDDAASDLELTRTDSYVVFQLDGESYALEVSRVQEVLDVAQLTRVPGAPRALSGLYNLRGHVVPVWNLREPFGIGPIEPGSAPPCVLMVESPATAGAPGRVAGLLVDRVSDVLEMPPDELQSAPTIGLGGSSAFVRGLIRHHDRFLLVLDLDRVFGALSREPSPVESS
jgi:purine-binding chemotaxis protein CheW